MGVILALTIRVSLAPLWALVYRQFLVLGYCLAFRLCISNHASIIITPHRHTLLVLVRTAHGRRVGLDADLGLIAMAQLSTPSSKRVKG
ncbi:hypothetical protein EDD21DRAFT_389817 [Dissophora ornata]|nr:hypothetical protein EDD21DRAFT_389817 [Dissophora ornata]